MKSWILSDQSQNLWLESLDEKIGCWTICKKTLRVGLSQGVDLLTVSNGTIALDIIPTRGMNIWQGRVGDVRLGWDSPVKGPVHPGFVNLEENGGIGWAKGFDEWIARCGLAWMGAPCNDVVRDPFGNEAKTFLPLHGRIANLPAHYVEVSIDEASEILTVYGIVDETVFLGDNLRLHSRLFLKPGEAGFAMEDTIENLGGTEQGYQILYHTNFGKPILDEGATLEADFLSSKARDQIAEKGLSRMSTYGPPTAGAVEQVYFHDIAADENGLQHATLNNPQTGIRATLSARKAELPCFIQWKNEAAEADGYVTGLEFGNGYPTGRKSEREAGRLRLLAPGESETTHLRFHLST